MRIRIYTSNNEDFWNFKNKFPMIHVAKPAGERAFFDAYLLAANPQATRIVEWALGKGLTYQEFKEN